MYATFIQFFKTLMSMIIFISVELSMEKFYNLGVCLSTVHKALLFDILYNSFLNWPFCRNATCHIYMGESLSGLFLNSGFETASKS